MRVTAATWHVVTLQMIDTRARILIGLLVVSKVLDILARGWR